MASEVLAALFKAVSALAALGVPHALFGGMAAQIWGRIRSTMDVDILVDPGSASAETVTVALRNAGFAHQEGVDRTRLENGLLLRFWHPVGSLGLSVKVDIVLATGALETQALSRRTERHVEDGLVPVVTCEDLVLLKMLSGRPVDLADASDLLHRWDAHLDRVYLDEWAGRMSLSDRLRSARETPQTS